LNEGKRLISVFFAPTALFEDLREKQRWIVPFIICILLAGLVALLPRLFVSPEVWLDIIRNNMSNVKVNIQVSPETMIQQMLSPIAIVFATLEAMVVFSIFTFGISLIFWAIFAIFGGGLNFKKSLSVVSYTGLITIVGALVTTLLSILFQRLDITLSLAALPIFNPDSIWYRLANQINFFAVWRVLVMGLGFAVIGQLKRSKGFLIVIISWLVAISLQNFIPIIIKSITVHS